MSDRSQRGRTVTRQQRNPLPVFYIILAVVAIIGIAAISTIALRNRQQITANPGRLLTRAPLTAPTGQTPEGYHYKGKADAPVTVIEYSDYQCPYCGRFATNDEMKVDQDYVETGKIQYIFHDYPLQQHTNAVPAAIAGRCAGDQKAFWPMHDFLFANQVQWENLKDPTQQFLGYAQQLKLDVSAFQTCLSNEQHRNFIDQSVIQGSQVQIPGTPTFFVNGKMIGSDPTQLRTAIDAALASAK